MANNRMFLIHKPSKLGVMLGKRMGWGWYAAPEKEELDRFYEYLSGNEEDQDAFIIAMEDCSESNCFDDWRYTPKKVDGFILFEYK
jgi:hypothetical protein